MEGDRCRVDEADPTRTLWVKGNPECLRSIDDRFDVSKASVYRACRVISTRFMVVFIKFPSCQADVLARRPLATSTIFESFLKETLGS